MKKGVLIVVLLSISLISSCTQQVSCDKPYILVGSSCCLDQNDNSICDNDEQQIQNGKPNLQISSYGEYGSPGYNSKEFVVFGTVYNAGTGTAYNVTVACDYEHDKEVVGVGGGGGFGEIFESIAPGESKTFQESAYVIKEQQYRRVEVNCRIEEFSDW